VGCNLEERMEIVVRVQVVKKWLEETLIPDLRESGMNATADDFVKLVKMVRKYTK
jgi:hypothetical protein